MEEKQLKHDEDGINFLDYLIVLARRKKLIIGITMGAAVITAIISLIVSPIYQAETKILPPQQQASGMASQLQAIGQMSAGLGLGSLGLKNPGDLYMGMLKSRPVLDRIIERFDLMNLYEAKYHVDARLKLLRVLNVRDDKKSSIITVNVEDKDPKRAADMTNAFIEELKNLNKGLSVTEASQRRLFFEEQLKDAKMALSKAEEAMKGFQEKTGAVRMEAQAYAVVGSISQVRAQIAAKEVQLRVMRTYSTAQNPDLQRVMEELKGLQAQLAGLESRNSGRDGVASAGSITSAGTEYIRKLRDLKFNEMLYELLLKQYEAAKLDEGRDATVIQVIEPAVPPERRVWPKRTLMVLLAAFAGFFISVFTVFFMEYRKKALSIPENRERYDTLMKYLNIKDLKLKSFKFKLKR